MEWKKLVKREHKDLENNEEGANLFRNQDIDFYNILSLIMKI